jgi:hypothetical protein
MPVRTAYVGTQVAGDVLTAANFTKLPGGWIGYAEAVANQAAIVAEIDLTSLTVTVTVGTSRRIKVTGEINFINTLANQSNLLRLHADGAQVQSRQLLSDSAGGTETLHLEWVGTPTPGAHTYKLRAAAGGGSMTMVAGASQPAFILVEDLGPAA